MNIVLARLQNAHEVFEIGWLGDSEAVQIGKIKDDIIFYVLNVFLGWLYMHSRPFDRFARTHGSTDAV